MPSYYNPYNFFPATYSNPYQQNVAMQPQPQPQQPKLMEWVEGEVGAKAFQMPMGWPANQPIPLWDSTDTNIFLKSWGPMGIPNPLQKLHYTMPEQQNPTISGTTDTRQFVTRKELEELKNELMKKEG